MRNLINENRQLLRLIARFHGQPSQLVHQERWPTEVPEPVRRLLQNSAAGQRRLRNWMNETWNLDPEFHHTFAEPRHRVALLAPDRLQSLKLHCGAAIHSVDIARAIDRSKQTEFRELLGENAYNFAMKRASFLIGKLPDELKAAPTTVDEIISSGQRCIASCLQDAPGELLRRLELALSPASPLSVQQEGRAERDAEHTKPIWTFVKRILLTEVAPEMKPCFA